MPLFRPFSFVFRLFLTPAIIVASLLSSGCARTPSLSSKDVRLLAENHSFRSQIVHTAPFTISAWVRHTSATAPVTYYIEGDGMAWISRFEISPNPTPRNPIAFRLALLDPSPNVVYLARPCQYEGRKSAACRPSYWTSARFSSEVLESMNQAIEATKGDAKDVHLVGYSGGGALAALLAASRTDVLSLRTVAGNLDHAALNAYHKVSPMPDSLNPIDVAKHLQGLPQLHLSGGADRVVPPFIAQRFAAAVQGGKPSSKITPSGDCVTLQTVAGATHTEGWDVVWQRHTRPPTCRRARSE